MDFRAAAAALPPPAAHMPALFTQPPALPPPPPPSQAGLFLYPGLSSPVKPPSHLLPSHKVSPRNTATVPPLLQTPAPVSSGGQQAGPPTVSTASSQANSFAAALKSLARNAGGTDAKESAPPPKPSRDPAPAMSPKRVPLHVPRAPHTDNPPPVVAIAPTPTQQRSREPPAISTSVDLKSCLPAEVTSQLTAAAAGDLSRAAAGSTGFQPYRADEQQRLLESLYPGYASAASAASAAAASAAAAAAVGSLYPPAPARSGYPPPPPPPRRPEDRYLESLYPLQHPLQHTLYGLEEQLYLERLGLLRPPLGVGVSGLSPYTPLLSTGRYPPPTELLHSPLYMSQSLYLQERLKLEEDTRRKLETEREQRSERERTEREQRAERSERSREPTSHAVTPSVRERSPVRPADPGSSGALKAEPRGSGATSERRSPGERRSASSGGEQQTSPAAYRPYLPSPVPRPAPREPPLDLRTGADPAPVTPAVPAAPAVTSAPPAPAVPAVPGVLPMAPAAPAAPPLVKPRSHKKTTVVRPFEDTVTTSVEPPAPVPVPAAPAVVSSVAPAFAPVAAPAPAFAPAPAPAAAPVVAPMADAPLNLSERNRTERVEPPHAAAPAERLTSTLDRREELRRRGLQPDEAEPVVRHLDLLTGPPCKTVTSPEKLQFLAHVGLTTHSYKNDVELKKCERRAALHLPLSAATSPEGAAEPEPELEPEREPEPEPEPRPSSRLTAALNESADLPAKLLFLERLGLRPVTAAGAGPAGGAGVQAGGSTGGSSSSSGGSGGASPSGAASSSSGGGSPSQRKSDNSSRRDSAPADEKGRRNRSSPSSRSSRSSRPGSQAAQTAAAAAAAAASPPEPPAAEVAPRLALPGAAWPGMQAVTQMYTSYNKERAAATEQARRNQERLRAQQARLEETSRGLALRLNRQVAFRSLQWRQREAIQEQLDRLGALVHALPTRARRKH